MSEALLTVLANLATFEHLFHLALGVMLGLAVGAFPGLGGIAGLAIMMPFLYGMDTVSALATLVGLVAVIPTSDTFTSVLMGIPGSSASQATVLDGFPLSQQGHAARALAAAFTASLMGGIVGAVILNGVRAGGAPASSSRSARRNCSCWRCWACPWWACSPAPASSRDSPPADSG